MSNRSRGGTKSTAGKVETADSYGATSGNGFAATAAGLTEEQQRLVTQHIGLVGVHLRTRVPTPYQPTRDRERDDLFQEGCVALVRAARRYRPERDGEFAAYALLRIRGAVFSAIHDQFTTIRVPAGGSGKMRESASPPVQRPLDAAAKSRAVTHPAELPDDHSDETLHHALRRRYERAVAIALDDLRHRTWRRRNPCDIMVRIAAERLLIPSEKDKTPLRALAREVGVSSGRLSSYESRLKDTVNGRFAEDPHVPMLMKFARRDPKGFEGRLTRERREGLVQAELAQFRDRFDQLDRPARTELLYDLIERSTSAVSEVACNLFQLTRSDEDECLTALS